MDQFLLRKMPPGGGGGGANQLEDLLDVDDTTGTGTTVVLDTSPTILTPTIADFSNAPHDHADAAGGGAIVLPAKYRTRTAVIQIKLPAVTDWVLIKFLRADITMVQVRATAQAGSFGIQIERRTTLDPTTKVADVLSGTLTASSGESVTTSFVASGVVAADQDLVLVAKSESGDPAWGFVHVEWLVD
jgi:hypothetical protein